MHIRTVKFQSVDDLKYRDQSSYELLGGVGPSSIEEKDEELIFIY